MGPVANHTEIHNFVNNFLRGLLGIERVEVWNYSCLGDTFVFNQVDVVRQVMMFRYVNGGRETSNSTCSLSRTQFPAFRFEGESGVCSKGLWTSVPRS